MPQSVVGLLLAWQKQLQSRYLFGFIARLAAHNDNGSSGSTGHGCAIVDKIPHGDKRGLFSRQTASGTNAGGSACVPDTRVAGSEQQRHRWRGRGVAFALDLGPTLALRSIDLSHNRLRDAGATALAAFLTTHATKLSCLESLDLFENGIRDHGARTLTNMVQELVLGPLGQQENVNLHDNDISEAVLSEIDDVWSKINVKRPPEWERKRATTTAASLADGAAGASGRLLLSQMSKVHNDIKREKEHIELTKKRELERIDLKKRLEAERIARERERVREECIVSTLVKLQSLSEFLKRVLWEFVTVQRKALADPMVLRVFRLLSETEQEAMPIRYGVDRNSTVYRDGYEGYKAYQQRMLDADGFSSYTADEPHCVAPLATGGCAC